MRARGILLALGIILLLAGCAAPDESAPAPPANDSGALCLDDTESCERPGTTLETAEDAERDGY